MQDVIFNGPETWIVMTDNGQTRAIHTLGTRWNKPADDPSARGSLSDLLNAYADKQRVSARLQSGGAVVAGQATYLIEIAPSPTACAVRSAVSPVPAASPEPRISGQLSSSRLENVNQPVMRVWIDKQTFLPLKTEVRDAGGTVVERSEVTRVEYNVSVPEATFNYSPPAGVQVSSFSGGTGADVKRVLFEGLDPKVQPAKKP